MKNRKTALALVLMAAIAVTGCVQKTYEVGGAGPTGGLVFYDHGFATEEGWRYLEAAPVGAEFKAEWGAYGKDVKGTETKVGSGKRNTELIIAFLKETGETGKAAQMCASLNINGRKDWFLPSRDELNFMYENLKRKGIGNFSNEWYWSSSQDGSYDGDYAWGQDFDDGYQSYTSGKNITLSVRAVRAF
jgi:hypothetical protein